MMVRSAMISAALTAALLGSVGLSGSQAASMSVSVTGAVVSPTNFDAASLAALPQLMKTETYLAGGTPVVDTFFGPSLWGVLQASGGIKTDASIKNDVLRTYIVATGADGYRAAIATGEIAPNFGNKPDLVAIKDTKGQLPGADGVARITASGDVKGGRYVSELKNLQVATAPTQPGTGPGTTSSFKVEGHVATPKTETLASLEAFTPHTETVTYHAGSTPVTDTYTGALLWDVLGAAGFVTDASVKNDILQELVTATGSDGYQVTFSLGELDPDFGNEPILVAYSDTLGQLAGTDGFARLVVPGDFAGGRYVSNLSDFSVFHINAVPLPSSAPMFGAALLVLGAARYALRRRKAAVAI